MGRAIEVHYAGEVWTVDPTILGPAARLEWCRRAYDFEIKLSDSILPGTDLSVDFKAILSESFSGWHIAFALSQLGFNDVSLLADWISGVSPLRDHIRLKKFELGGTSVSFASNQVLLSVDRNLGLRFGHPEANDQEIALGGDSTYSGGQLFLQPQKGSGNSYLAAVDHREAGPHTLFSLLNPRTSDVLAMGRRRTRKGLGFMPSALTECCGEAYDSPSGFHSVTLVCGEGTFGRVCEKTNRLLGDTVQLEHAALLRTAGNRGYKAAIAGRVSRVVHRIDFGAWGASVGGDDAQPLYARFGDEHDEGVVLRATLHNLTLPIEDADLAEIEVLRQPVALMFDGGPPAQKVAALSKVVRTQREFGQSIILTGDNPVALLHLEDARLTLRRSVDLLNLSFSFEGFDLRIRRGVPILRRRRTKTPGQWAPANIAVHFPPQHIAETWFNYQDPSTIPPAANLPPTPIEKPKFSEVEQARLSGESRIVFRVKDEPHKLPRWLERRITVEALTDWSDLAINVNLRALGPNKSIEEQVGISGITPQTSFDEAIRLAEATLKPPEARETALEMSGRLILSPSEGAKWQSPRGHVNVKDAVLWHAKLDQDSRKAVRALWSNWMVPGKFLRHQQIPPYKAADKETAPAASDPLLVLSADKHWNIVAQTSLYGLIALRGSEDDLEKPPETFTTSLVNGFYSLFKASPEPKRIPRNRVVTPKGRFECLEYLKQDAKNRYPAAKNLQTYGADAIGFALVEPFEDANIILTSLGGSLAAEWNGEPFAMPAADTRLPPTFNLERFIYRSQLGRDIHVETYDKGYLLPLGIRASYVELSERRFFAHPRYGYPVAYLVKRTFIVIRRPEKRLPAVGQQYDSRDFPAERILMLTKTTPDLRSPMDASKSTPVSWKSASGEEVKIYSNGRLTFSKLQEGDLVFWPRTTEGLPGTSGDVEFKWTLDDDHTPSAGNLLFVSNSCSHNPDAMHVIADYYRDLGRAPASTPGGDWSPLRKVRIFGTRRRYAAAKPEAETAFDTDSWLLSLRGPTDLSGNNESFVITESMERADQPPFFPVVEKARIAMQSLDRLVGSPQGLLEVQFYHAYIAKGFDGNKAELFLEVLHPVVRLDVNNNGAATGGLGRTNAILAALSRVTGFVGGQDHPLTANVDTNVNTVQSAGFIALQAAAGPANPSPPSRTTALVGPQPHPTRFTFPSSEGGDPKFNPEEFFDKDAKLLGLVTFRDLFRELFRDLPLPAINKAPKLLETIGYGPSGDLKPLALHFVSVAKQLDGIGPAIDTQLELTKTADGQKLTFQTLYPTLSVAISDLSSSLREAPTLPVLGNILVRGRRVLSELQRVLEDPVPEFARKELADLAARWEGLKNLPRGIFSAQTSSLVAIFDHFVDVLTTRAMTLGLQSVLLGRASSIVDDAASVLSGVEDSLFSSMLALPVAAANRGIRDLQNAASLSVDRIGQAIQVNLEAMTTTVEFAQVVDAGHVLATWSKAPLTPETARVVRFAYETASGLGVLEAGSRGSSPHLSRKEFVTSRQMFREAVNKLKIVDQTRQDLVERLDGARSQFLNESEGLSASIESLCLILFGPNTLGNFSRGGGLERLRAWFDKGSKPPNVPIDLLQIETDVTEIVRFRRLILRQVESVAARLKDLDSIIRSDRATTQLSEIQSLSRRLVGVLLAVTSVDQTGSGSRTWQLVSADLEFLESRLNGFRLFTEGIAQGLAFARTTAPKLRDKLLSSNADASSLPALSEECRVYLEKADKQIAALGLQTVALPITDARVLMLSAAKVLVQCASSSADLYALVSSAVQDIKSQIEASALKPLVSSTISSRVDQLIVGLKTQSDLLKHIASQGAELANVTDLRDLGKLAWASKSADEQRQILARLDAEGARLSKAITNVVKSSQEFITGLAGQSTMTLLRSIAALDDVVTNALQESVSGLLNGSIRTTIDKAVSDLQDVLTQILPTSTDLAYQWDTQFPKDYDGGVFSFGMEEPQPDPKKPHFSLRTNIKVNFLNGDRHATTESRLGPFKIALFKNLVTIKFHEAVFKSGDGAESALSVRFNTVELGPGLEFLKALQSLLSPGGGNGPYLSVTPSLLAVGYRYDAGLIQVGNLQFIHVSLHVFTELPLRELANGSIAARIGFGFGTEARPFLIAAPPYGGGGYVQLLFEGGRLRPLISLSFGAVVAIQFGPLSGHGRVTSTITWGSVIRASVEAVGEGHLGCFGIAVMLQIALQQDGDGGDLVGSATYSFSFTVGFLSFSFSFSAHYTIHGGSDPESKRSSNAKVASYLPADRPRTTLVSESYSSQQPPRLLLIQNTAPNGRNAVRSSCEVEDIPATRRIKVVAPQKSTAWRAYRDRLSMSLLED